MFTKRKVGEKIVEFHSTVTFPVAEGEKNKDKGREIRLGQDVGDFTF